MRSYVWFAFILMMLGCQQNQGSSEDAAIEEEDLSGSESEERSKKFNRTFMINEAIADHYIENKAPKFKRNFPDPGDNKALIEQLEVEKFYQLSVDPSSGLLQGYLIQATGDNTTSVPFMIDMQSSLMDYSSPSIRKNEKGDPHKVDTRMSLIVVMRLDKSIYVTQVSKQCLDKDDAKIYLNMDKYAPECKNMVHLSTVDHADLGGLEKYVLFSGRIELEDGRITRIGNNSGNYPNTNDSFKSFMLALASQGYMNGHLDFSIRYRFNPNKQVQLTSLTRFMTENTTLPEGTIEFKRKKKRISLEFHCPAGGYTYPTGISKAAERYAVVQGINFAVLDLDASGDMLIDEHEVEEGDFLLAAYCPGEEHKKVSFYYAPDQKK